MEKFLSDDFLLQNRTAKHLFHGVAKELPIIDYHSHLPPDEITEDRRFNNITNIWLDGDHYKWRAMRILGIDEKYITGQTDELEKFKKWAYALPYTLRNPLYHWSHLELKNYFGVTERLQPDNAEKIYNHCNRQLESPEFSARNLLLNMKVEVVCTTDDPADTLSGHKKIVEQDFPVRVLPTFRPDRAYAFEQPEDYNSYLDELEKVSGREIRSLEDLLEVLEMRVEFFHQAGCRLSDHGMEKMAYQPASSSRLEKYFSTVRSGKAVEKNEAQSLTNFILRNLGLMYHKRGWVQQFHLGALRNANTRMFQRLGPATGFDSIGDFPQSLSLAKFLDELDKTDHLPKTVLYNLNPADNAMMATMAGNFNDGSKRGKIQFGTAWWFLDQKDGIEEQMNILSNMGLLSCFIGMLTDSRSFLSYPRHEYFRRILCNLIGTDVEKGFLPNDPEWLGKIVADISYHNAKNYFNF